MPINGLPICVLIVSEEKEGLRLRELLDSNDSTPFQIFHVSSLDLAAEHLSDTPEDVLLIDLGSKQQQGRAFVEAARAAAPDMPVIILSESENEDLAIEALKLGVQDFLPNASIDAPSLARSLRHSIERYRLQQTVQRLSLIDDLTGLHNRRGFSALAEQHLRVIRRKGAALLLYVDLDDLKAINDTHGHLVGNGALVLTANILRACFRQSDILARLGGDEFCVLMTDAVEDSAQQVRNRIQQRVDFINALAPAHFRLSLSIGIADVSVVHELPLDELLRIADSRMYDEKRNKRATNSLAAPVGSSP